MNVMMRIITEDNIDQMINLNYTDQYKELSKDLYVNTEHTPETIKSIASRLKTKINMQNADIRGRNTIIRGVVEHDDVGDDDMDQKSPDYGPAHSPPYAPSGNTPDMGDYDMDTDGMDDGPFWHPNSMSESFDNMSDKPDEADLKFDGDDAENKFVKFYKKKYPDSTPDVIEMAYLKFLEDGEIVDANSMLIPDEFDKEDKSDVKKKFINRTGVPDLRTLENDPDDDDEDDKDGKGNSVDTGDMGGGNGKFILKKIL